MDHHFQDVATMQIHSKCVNYNELLRHLDDLYCLFLDDVLDCHWNHCELNLVHNMLIAILLFVLPVLPDGIIWKKKCYGDCNYTVRKVFFCFLILVLPLNFFKHYGNGLFSSKILLTWFFRSRKIIRHVFFLFSIWQRLTELQ